jgi:kumamolisin
MSESNSNNTDPSAMSAGGQTPEPIALVPLPGSERPAAAELRTAALAPEPANPATAVDNEPVEATVILRRRAPLEQAGTGTPTPTAEFAAAFGADPDDAALVTSTLEALGITTVSSDLASRRLRISGSVSNISRAFGTSITLVPASTQGDGAAAHRYREGALSIPAALDGVVTAVLGIDDRPQAKTQYRIARGSSAATATNSGGAALAIAKARAASVSYTPPELGRIYAFPAGTDGAGQTIAIIELGGGYRQSDLDTYFDGLGLTVPTLTAVGVDGASNSPGDASGADGEVLLDIEVAGALSPASNIVVYFAPNTDAGFLDAVAEAAHATPTPAAISISWGQSEDQWTAQARAAFDDALADAVQLGATVTAAAGDNGSSDGSADGTNHADFPASSPHALACGGTSLRASGGTVQSETVWNDGSGGATGGGVSDVFGLPSWQEGVGVPTGIAGATVAATARTPVVPRAIGGRGVPDVAANADPNTGYEVLINGERAVYGGTSAVAPLWAALIARMAQSLDRPLGLLQPALYASGAGFRDVVTGDNGSYSAGPGWDACTGLGVPNGTALLAALRS